MKHGPEEWEQKDEPHVPVNWMHWLKQASESEMEASINDC